MSAVSTYTSDKGNAICEALASGRSLLSICKELGIAYMTAYDWERTVPEHAVNSARAREIGCHALADQTLEIADDARNDWIDERAGDDEGAARAKANGEQVQRSRLRIDTRLRLLGKWLPKVYGDKVDLTGTLRHDITRIEAVIVDPPG